MQVKRTIRLGTRGSALALVQSRWVASELEKQGYEVDIQIIRTTGDRVTDIPLGSINGKGVFVSEIEQALTEGSIDLAVHSMKDLPPDLAVGLKLAAVPKREDPRDVIVGRTAGTLSALQSGAIVGTSSPRRRAQLMASRSDIVVTDLRGNLDTRLRKLDEGQYDAICLAAAGLHRLDLVHRITEHLDAAIMLPAAGQGALALETRADDEHAIAAVSGLHDEATSRAVDAERETLAELGWGCSVPLGLLAVLDNEELSLDAALCKLDGSVVVRENVRGSGSPADLGREMGRRLKVHTDLLH
jgi:hydroxymethylbilane synthase